MNTFLKNPLPFLLLATGILSCGGNNSIPSKDRIVQLHLKNGQLISCGPTGGEFGLVNFESNCSEKVSGDFNIAVELLHSFEYDESEKVFAKIINESPDCAMAYWGVAMCNFHPLWEPPTETDLRKGAAAIGIATSLLQRSQHQSDYINAVAAYYKDWGTTDPHTRSIHFEKAMEATHLKYPEDKEAAIFYALALDAAADPTDKSYANQKKAGEILNTLYASEPNHPGVIHYIIHTYDYPGIADLGLQAARRYAGVAPSSAHALHMPSHIFTRLGLWNECISSNVRSVASAQCYGESAGIKGHWDEELHGLDYLMYAYLQKGDNSAATELLKYITTIKEVYPVNFKGAYTFAAAPSRMALENKNWQQAASLQLHPANFPWNKFPWQEAIIHFARLLGAAHLGDRSSAQSELAKLNMLYDTLQKQKDLYKSKQVGTQIKIGEAWVAFMNDKRAESLNRMSNAADREDSTSKHPVTPGEVLPARELYADMLLQTKQNETALQTYESVLQKSPNRFNSLYGAGVAAERSGNAEKAVFYYKRLVSIADPNSNRPELLAARSFLKEH
jgi:tetratricopeptide (TPR) repeat protein